MSMPVSAADKPLSPYYLIIRASLIEVIRRKEFAVLLILMGLFALGVVITRIVGIESPATGTFLLNLGLTLAIGLAQLLTILHSARQFPDELETRTLHPLLAKPITRGQYLLGKWLGSTLAGLFVLVVLNAMAWVPVPKLEPYDTLKFLQMLLLQMLSIGMVAALAQLASMVMPKLIASTVVLVVLFGGGPVINFLIGRADVLGYGGVSRWFAGYVPRLEPLDLVLPYTSGLGPENLMDFGSRVLYGVVVTCAALAISSYVLNRKPL